MIYSVVLKTTCKLVIECTCGVFMGYNIVAVSCVFRMYVCMYLIFQQLSIRCLENGARYMRRHR